jgi:hypothetical protein
MNQLPCKKTIKVKAAAGPARDTRATVASVMKEHICAKRKRGKKEGPFHGASIVTYTVVAVGMLVHASTCNT